MRIAELALPGGNNRFPGPIPQQHPFGGLGQTAKTWVYELGPVPVLDANKRSIPDARAEVFIGQPGQSKALYKGYDVSGGQFPMMQIPAPANSEFTVVFSAPDRQTVVNDHPTGNIDKGSGMTMAYYTYDPVYLLKTGEVSPDSAGSILTNLMDSNYLLIGLGAVGFFGLGWWLKVRKH